tara:strand:- start:400 stop:2118 length:1719 start_codon:yes stop_codon:yes gene_type:complete
MIKDLIKFLSKKEKILLFFLLISIFFGTLLEVLSYALIIPVLTIIIKSKASILEIPLVKNNIFLTDYFLSTTQQDMIIHSLFIIVIFFLIKNFLLISLVYFRESYFFGLKARLSKNFFKNYIQKEYSEFIENNSSFYITNILNEVAMLVEKRIRSIIYILNETLIISFFSISLLLINFNLTIIIFLIFFFILFSFLLITKKINLKFANLRQLYDLRQIKDLNESFTLFKYIKIHHLEKMFYERFSNSNKQVNNAGKFEIILNEIPKNIFEIASIVTISAAILFFFTNNTKIIELIPFLGFLVLSISRLIPSLTRISNSIQNFRFSEPSIDVLKKEINFNNEKFANLKEKSKESFELFKLQNISFKYGNKNVLKNISYSFHKNFVYGITGETGSGKTTLIDIITGIHKNYLGDIILNKKKINRPMYNLINIGYVPQDIFLIDDTIKNNILINNIKNEKISKEKLYKILDIVNLSKFLSKLNFGMNTFIGENGAAISGGQKQRIGLARALLNDPQLLILDEATNALNQTIAEEIINNLKNQNITVILISHDKEIIKYCDKVLYLKEGNLKIIQE